ncbi:MAG: NAD-dependent epimerase/dehydratase family protein [Candidatus Latescibacteria bacterium]|nr:NAD-dependent epimerase/dehydratase family protein [Candidatus Latescibacterota bacterium]
MRVLIIGGTGNISSAIAAQLIGRGDQVVLYNRGKIRPQFEGEYQVIVGDRTDHARFEAQVRQAGVFDCAIDMIGYEPEDAHSAVRACRGRVGRFVFCSTVDVYTKSGARYPVREDAERSPAPAFPYAYKKAQLERILEAAQEEGAFLLTITRPAATYNDSSAPIPLVGKGTLVFHRLRRGLPLILLGDGTSLWVIWHRDDVARAFVAALDNPAAAGRSYHVTGEQWLTWEIYYQTAARVLGVQADFARIPTELLVRMAPAAAEWCGINFCFNNLFDNAAAKADLGFCYTITWEEGVRRMVAYHDAQGAIDACPPEPLYDRIVEVWGKLSAAVPELEQGGAGPARP